RVVLAGPPLYVHAAEARMSLKLKGPWGFRAAEVSICGETESPWTHELEGPSLFSRLCVELCSMAHRSTQRRLKSEGPSSSWVHGDSVSPQMLTSAARNPHGPLSLRDIRASAAWTYSGGPASTTR